MQTPRITRWNRLLAGGLLGIASVTAAVSDPPPAPPRVREVVVVFKTHFDIGYTDMASNVVARYRTAMIDQALDVVDANRTLPPDQQFVWTLPGWPLTQIAEAWPGQTPERRQRILDALAQGRFAVHALPFTTHTELLEPEDLVRGLDFSSDLSKATGRPLPRDAKMTDVPSHSWILPTLLRHAGVDFLHLGCNAASRSPHVPRLFWWEGPDGSRLLTMYTAESYGTGLVPPQDWPHSTWLALIHTGDNHGPPKPNEVKQLLANAATQLPGVTIRIGRLSDFADAILAGKPDLPVVRGDMPDTWIHGPMADPRGASIARNLRPALVATESLATHLTAWNVPGADVTAPLAEAFEQSLLYGEHTWGGAFWWIYGKYTLPFGDAWKADRAAGKFARIESSWDEHTGYIEQAQRLLTPILADRMQALAGAVAVPGRRIVVFNPLPWKRSGLVRLDLAVTTPPGLKPCDGGETVPSQTADGLLLFLARDIPAMGYRTFEFVAAPPPTPTATADTDSPILESPFFKAVVDPARGILISLTDKRTGRELIDPRAPQGFGQYLYERFDRDQVQAFVKAYVKINADWATNELGKPSLPPASEVPYAAASPSHFTLRIRQDAVATTATLNAAARPDLAHSVTTRFVLYRDLPCLDVELTVHHKPFDPWPEAGWLSLPLAVHNPQFRLARLGSIVDPAADIIEGCNFDQLALNGGLTVTGDDGRGVGLCPLDSPLVSLGQPGGWQYSATWKPRPGRVYLNVFNNQWTTNFRLWNAGTWTSRVRLWSVDGDNAEQNLITPSDEARSPLVAAVADGPAGTLPPAQTGLELSRRGVRVTAFGPNARGKGTLLRLWEHAGYTGDCEVRLPRGLDVATIQPVDLRGLPSGKTIAVRQDRFTLPLRAFAPSSLLLQP